MVSKIEKQALSKHKKYQNVSYERNIIKQSIKNYYFVIKMNALGGIVFHFRNLSINKKIGRSVYFILIEVNNRNHIVPINVSS